MPEASDEEKKQRNREANKRCYYNNHSYYLLQKSSYKQSKQESKKMKFRKPIIFFGFPKNEFLFKEIKSILYKNQKIKANQIIIILLGRPPKH